ncbi:MFS transporter [Romboutsia sp.]|uniref:MFS transporter n=1 Tax=Romboutsia sp. TaxID=1965302 RepID=UPI003F2E9EFB
MDKNKINKILFINFITMTTFNMAHPVTPTLINTLGLPTYMFGVLYSTMAIAQFVMAPIWGSISDAKGRKKVLIIGVIGYGISQLGFGLAQTSTLILLFRILGGALSVGFMTGSIAYVSDVSTKEERIKYMSYHTATMSIASSCGALLGGAIGGFGYKYAFITQFVLTILVGVCIYLLLDETIENKSKEVKIYLEHLKPGKKSIDLKSIIGIMMIIMTLATIATTSYNSTINFYVESVLNMPTIVNGIVMAIAGVIALMMNLFVNPYLGKKFDENKTIVAVLGIAGISIVISSLSSNMIVALIFLAMFIASSALITPLQQSIVSKLAKNNYGEVMGIQGSFKAIGMVTGSLVSGFIFDYGNKLPFLLGGVCCLFAFILLYKVFIGNNKQELKKVS